MKELSEMLKNKKKDKKMSKSMEDKMEILQQLKEMASGMIGSDLSELKKITVAAKDTDGLKKGLEKAEEMLGDDEESEDEYC